MSASLKGTHECHFTHLFLDEAAQATEPECLIPLSVVVDPEPGSRKVEIALVGDPRQLSPNVHSTTASQAGLSRSWMERLLQRPVKCLGGGHDHMLGPELVSMEEWVKYSLQGPGHEQLSVFLTLNYRGHPSFLMLPSALFYSDKLRSADHLIDNHSRNNASWCEKLRWVESLSEPVQLPSEDCSDGLPELVGSVKQFNWPIHFRGVAGKDTVVSGEADFASNSWSNEEEAIAVAEIIVTLVDRGVPTQSLGVMAPFRCQVMSIRNILRSKNLAGVNVGTIEDYQAVERDVIVLSLTRSTQAFVSHDKECRMGVFGQPKRSNVALTRAEHLLIVVRQIIHTCFSNFFRLF